MCRRQPDTRTFRRCKSTVTAQFSLISSQKSDFSISRKASIELAEPSHPSPQKQAFAIENEAYKTSNTLVSSFS